MLRPLMLRAGLAGLILAFLASAALAASGDRKDIVLRGLVTDGAGRPVPSARVSASGALEFATIASATGRYVLTIRVGTVGALVRQPMTFVIEARDGGTRVPIEGGPAKLELKLMSLADSLGQPHVEARSNFAALDHQLNFGLRQPGDGEVPAALNFSRHKGGAAPAVIPVVPTPAAAASPVAPTPAASPGAATASPASPPAPVAPAAGTQSAKPAPVSIVAAPPAPAAATTAIPDTRPKTKKKEPATAMELLEATRQQGSVFSSGPLLDSLSGRFPSEAPKLVGSDGVRSMERTLDSLSRAVKQEQKRRHSFLRDSVRAARSSTKHGFQRDAAVAGASGAAGVAQSSARFAGPSHADSLAAIQRAAEVARRDSAKIAQRAKESDREAAHRLSLERESMRHDSTLAAMRMRDSLRAVTRIWEGARAAQRRDSLKAAKPAPPTLDPRPPVAGHVPGAATAPDTCRCRIHGTIEARTDHPLSSPLQVTISVRGATSLASHVRLDMGSPRAFTFERVPCGARVLDVAIAGGRRFTVLTPAELKVNCAAGRLIQPRIAIRPN